MWKPGLPCELISLLPQRIIMALPIRAVNMVKVGRVCSRMLSSSILYGYNKPQAEELQLSHGTTGWRARLFPFIPFRSKVFTQGPRPGAAMGWTWVGILERACVYECLPSNLSQHFTKHAENRLTCTAFCLDPACPCPLRNLLLRILWSELISSLVTFSGRLSPNTLTPTPQAFTVYSQRTMFLFFGTFIWDVLLCLLVWFFGQFLSAPIDYQLREDGDCVWFCLLLYPQHSGWYIEGVQIFVEESNKWRSEWFYYHTRGRRLKPR